MLGQLLRQELLFPPHRDEGLQTVVRLRRAQQTNQRPHGRLGFLGAALHQLVEVGIVAQEPLQR